MTDIQGCQAVYIFIALDQWDTFLPSWTLSLCMIGSLYGQSAAKSSLHVSSQQKNKLCILALSQNLLPIQGVLMFSFISVFWIYWAFIEHLVYVKTTYKIMIPVLIKVWDIYNKWSIYCCVSLWGQKTWISGKGFGRRKKFVVVRAVYKVCMTKSECSE